MSIICYAKNFRERLSCTNKMHDNRDSNLTMNIICFIIFLPISLVFYLKMVEIAYWMYLIVIDTTEYEKRFSYSNFPINFQFY